MERNALLSLLSQVQQGTLTPAAASEQLASLPFEDAGFAKIDHHRSLRTGLPEVIFSSGKTPEQVAEIFARLAASGVAVLATRADAATFAAVQAQTPAALFNAIARTITLESPTTPKIQSGNIAVVCAGTSDIPVAEEATVTAELFGAHVDRIHDVGVAGVHRILAQRERLAAAHAVICCAGMEGALPSVVGGLVGVPVIAVPTSVGYGASFAGAAALLGMLNSCSPNVTVVNIDNGFGAAYVATMIARASNR
ncbi:MAG: nickel pincer cofactor biosynthesis protein LarB [Acidobacteriaceae bacterium]|nr:nickel pincer cofactor biosynthesis protein LarB [Acidobacteriaceae bacterium]